MTTDTNARKVASRNLCPRTIRRPSGPQNNLPPTPRSNTSRSPHQEEPLASLYWRLGLALTLARAKFKHGKWGSYMQSLGIDKTRASKAQAIYKANRNEKDVAGLSVAAAYARRQRKKPVKAEPAVMSDKAEFREFLKATCLAAEKYVDIAEFLAPAEAPEFILDVETTIRKLEDLRTRLRQRATP